MAQVNFEQRQGWGLGARQSQHPAFHTTNTIDTVMQGECLSLEAGKSDPAVILKPQQHGKTSKSEQFSPILGKKKYMQFAIGIKWIFLEKTHLWRALYGL